MILYARRVLEIRKFVSKSTLPLIIQQYIHIYIYGYVIKNKTNCGSVHYYNIVMEVEFNWGGEGENKDSASCLSRTTHTLTPAVLYYTTVVCGWHDLSQRLTFEM